MSVRFYIGLDRPWDARHFDRACVSVRTLRRRRKPIDCDEVLVDSGAFTEIALNGGYREPPAVYAAELRRLHAAGVGSVCKRNGDPQQIVAVLSAIHALRSDLRLHGFGIKRTALAHAGVRSLLWSCDSMAWSFAARYEGRDTHCWREAAAFSAEIAEIQATAPKPWQMPLPLWEATP